jgi:transposase-like protein
MACGEETLKHDTEIKSSKKRRRQESALKARVALEDVKGEKTIHEIAKTHEVHPTQVTEWKKTLLDNVSGVFETTGKLGAEDFDNERTVLQS